jgi:hypothetical protein
LGHLLPTFAHPHFDMQEESVRDFNPIAAGGSQQVGAMHADAEHARSCKSSEEGLCIGHSGAPRGTCVGVRI